MSFNDTIIFICVIVFVFVLFLLVVVALYKTYQNEKPKLKEILINTREIIILIILSITI